MVAAIVAARQALASRVAGRVSTTPLRRVCALALRGSLSILSTATTVQRSPQSTVWREWLHRIPDPSPVRIEKKVTLTVLAVTTN